MVARGLVDDGVQEAELVLPVEEEVAEILRVLRASMSRHRVRKPRRVEEARRRKGRSVAPSGCTGCPQSSSPWRSSLLLPPYVGRGDEMAAGASI